jgi:hypothetical protein
MQIASQLATRLPLSSVFALELLLAGVILIAVAVH